MNTDSFALRHIGPRETDLPEMLETIGVSSMDQLIYETVPDDILLKKALNLDTAMSEQEYLEHITELSFKNKVFKTNIGLGYNQAITPPVIQRNILENPGWYTAYTPYQAEIAQGRLEALLNFQTVVTELTGMELANASLLDEASAAAEAMSLLYAVRTRDKKKSKAAKFFVSEEILPQTLSVLQTRSTPIGIELVVGDHESFDFSEEYFGALLQYPGKSGRVHDFKDFIDKANNAEIKVAIAADILSLVILEAPGTFGVDVVVGTTQRFGIPLGYGGPHAAYFATKDEYKRNIPGRIIGVTKDKDGNRALRMALQTREQHIKRDRATSNICTAQVLLAVMAGMYAVYHGKKGIYTIAKGTHQYTVQLANSLQKLGFEIIEEQYFDTLKIGVEEGKADALVAHLRENEINIRKIDNDTVGISMNETVELAELNNLIACCAAFVGKEVSDIQEVIEESPLQETLIRKSAYLEHPVFNSYHSETEMMRYIKRLENKDFSLTHGMIPLGSCTMKLNAASELIPLTWPEFANIHPLAPSDQHEGYTKILEGLERDLSTITGFYKTSLQPNSGAQGEFAGLMVIRAYHHSRGEGHRDIALIPSSAHGTNPASAVMAGMKVVVVKCDDEGNIDVEDLKAKAEKHKDNLSSLMITYPSTHGVYEESVQEITEVIHKFGGQVYMDGANMNAQVGLTHPARVGADVCHLNLHKTFAIPHGGGGPGMGPIGVAKHLAPFLPSNAHIKTGGEQGISSISAAAYGSALVLLISYAYIKMLGEAGLIASTKAAILSANYLKHELKGAYDVLYQGENNTVAHEMILDCRLFKQSADIEVVDIAKRLIDYGFHAPTVSFPVNGTLMVEPTESEGLRELNRFVEAMMMIRNEITEIEEGKADKTNNLLKNSPHPEYMCVADSWELPYKRSAAAYPVDSLKGNKFWASVRRVDDAYGDRNLICSCPPISDYENDL